MNEIGAVVPHVRHILEADLIGGEWTPHSLPSSRSPR